MQKFNTLKSIPAYMPLVNIDTDMIIPKQFLKTIKRTGLGKNLFYEILSVKIVSILLRRVLASPVHSCGPRSKISQVAQLQ